MEVAARQRAPLTRQTYASVYGAFAAFVGPEATVMDMTAESVRAYRDLLEGAGRSPATVAKHLAALRGLAAAIGADGAIRNVRSARVSPGQPRALNQDQYTRLLRMPDRRTRRGLRDVAVLLLLGSAGLRRSEAANLLIGDIEERRRARDPKLRRAITRSTSWWVTVRMGKGGRSRRVPLDEETLAAIIRLGQGQTDRGNRAPGAVLAAYRSAPRTAIDARRRPDRLSSRNGRRAARCRRSPHVLRHTFCTHLADAGVDIAVIRKLAGHADIRTTTIYTAVNDARLEQAIAARSRHPHDIRRAAGEH